MKQLVINKFFGGKIRAYEDNLTYVLTQEVFAAYKNNHIIFCVGSSEKDILDEKSLSVFKILKEAQRMLETNQAIEVFKWPHDNSITLNVRDCGKIVERFIYDGGTATYKTTEERIKQFFVLLESFFENYESLIEKEACNVVY